MAPLLKSINIDPKSLHAYSTGLLQGIAYGRLQRSLTAALAPSGLSIPEWKLLGQLHDHGGMRLAELAAHLDYDPPMVTKLAKILEQKTLTKRTADTGDERAKVITITPKGQTLITQLEPVVKKAMAHLLKGVSHEDLITYLRVMATIVENTQG